MSQTNVSVVWRGHAAAASSHDVVQCTAATDVRAGGEVVSRTYGSVVELDAVEVGVEVSRIAQGIACHCGVEDRTVIDLIAKLQVDTGVVVLEDTVVGDGDVHVAAAVTKREDAEAFGRAGVRCSGNADRVVADASVDCSGDCSGSGRTHANRFTLRALQRVVADVDRLITHRPTDYAIAASRCVRMRIGTKVVERVAVCNEWSTDHGIHHRAGIGAVVNPISACALDQRRLQREVQRRAGVLRLDQDVVVAVHRVVETERAVTDRQPIQCSRRVNDV